jgi:hypothetical protein
VIEDTASSDLNHQKSTVLQPLYEAIISESVASCSENSRLLDFRNVNFCQVTPITAGAARSLLSFKSASRFPFF